ncbi:MAG TPA: cytochrome c family protein [Sphingomonas sp.]|jgi:cytochrome c|nr:cytochrome c family protein [Sphingomonas sp.]
MNSVSMSQMISTVAAIGAVAALGAAAIVRAAPPAGDPVKGKAIFARCAICHTVEPGKNKLGPSLAGVVGRVPASVPGFTYSAAMRADKVPWTVARLDGYLVNPRAMVPGTKMIFAGLPKPEDRANVIAYLANPSAAK